MGISLKNEHLQKKQYQNRTQQINKNGLPRQ
jgi:hypothetical protein